MKYKNIKISILLLIIVFFVKCTSAEITARYNNLGKNDTITLYLYNGLVSSNYNIVEISKYFDERSPVKYTLKILYSSEYKLNIKNVILEVDDEKIIINKRIYSAQKKRETQTLEKILFHIDENTITKICSSENILFVFNGENGKASFLLLKSHYENLKQFYKQVVIK